MMQMDDYFAHPAALQNIVDAYADQGTKWAITACEHDYDGMVRNYHAPQWTPDIWTGNNRLGSVSTLSMRKENALFFEEPLSWLVDCDLYYRLFIKYGEPKLITTANVVIDTRNDRLSHTLSDQLKAEETNYLVKKYGK